MVETLFEPKGHNPAVTDPNSLPATKALRSHVASNRGVFSWASRDSGRLIPLFANDLRLLDNLFASLFLPPARHR